MQRVERILPGLTIVAFMTALVAGFVGRWTVERDAAAVTRWDPRSIRPAIDPGPLAIPWLPVLLPFAIYAAWLVVNRRREGRSVVPTGDEETTRRARDARNRTVWSIVWVACWIPFCLLFLLGPFSGVRDPFVSGALIAPGPAVTEVVEGQGSRLDESLEDRTSFDEPPGCNADICPAPRYLARLQPGEVVTYLVTIRNRGPIGLTILGPDGPLQFGLPRDPAHPSADPADTMPFHPTTLEAGGELAVVLARVAGRCADPAASAPPRDLSTAYGFGLIYDVLGSWRTASVWPPVEVTIPGEDASSCAPDTAP